MELNNAYYQDEVREGFYIPGMIKRSWASQMEILEKVSEICARHDIKWHADYGTLIGAARHHGFIPWDDDLDISMLKDDYDRFLEVAESELPEGYRILNIYTEPTYNNFLTRIVNHSSIDTSEAFLSKNHGFPYVSGIDIFPLHYLYNDEEKENERQKKANTIFKSLEELLNRKYITDEDEKTLVKKAEEISGIKAGDFKAVDNAIYRILDKMYSEPVENPEYAVLTRFWIERKSHKLPVKYYENTIKVPFETGSINIPTGYDKILRLIYGNWEKTDKHGGMHDYPFYSDQEKILASHAGGKVPYIYSYDRKDLEKPSPSQAQSAASPILDTLDKAHKLLRILIKDSKYDQCRELFAGCINLVNSLGNSADSSAREKYLDIISNACDPGSAPSESTIDELENAFSGIKNPSAGPKSNDVIFIISRASDLPKIISAAKIFEGSGKNLMVMPVPYYAKDWSGNLTDEKYEYDEINIGVDNENNKDPEHTDLRICDINSYDLAANRPVVVTFYPLDEYSEGICLHPAAFSSELGKNAEKLIYVHTIPEKTPESDDEKGLFNAKRYIVSPGVIKSDEVYVPDESFRTLYISLLKETDSSVSWEDKIRIIPQS